MATGDDEAPPDGGEEDIVLDSFDADNVETTDEQEGEESKDNKLSRGKAEEEKLSAAKQVIHNFGLKKFFELRSKWSDWIIY